MSSGQSPEAGATFNYNYQYPYGPYNPIPYTPPVSIPATQSVLQIPSPVNLRLRALELAVGSLSECANTYLLDRAKAFYAFLTDTEGGKNTPSED